MMDFLYGELNYEIIKNKYEGARTTTATTTVDDALSRISVDVKCVPYKLLIINAESGDQYEYQGDVQQQITLHGYSLKDVTLVGSQYLHEYSLIKDNVEFGDRIIVPKDIYVNNIILRICEEENVPYNGAVVGERYLDVTFTNSSNHVYTSLKDFDLRIEEAQSDIDTHVARTDNPHSVTKTQVGLGNVVNKSMDNSPTADSDKYVKSGGVKSALDLKVDKTTTVAGNALSGNISAETLTQSLDRTKLITKLGEASTSLSGVMSATDKSRLDALYALLGSEDDADSVVNTFNEVLAVFNQYTEGAELVNLLANKQDKIDFIGDNESTNISYELANNSDKTFNSSNITNINLTIPSGISHGFNSGINFKSGSSAPSFSITNNSSFTLKLLVFGVEQTSYTPNSNFTVNISTYCDGINIYVYIVEV